MLSLPTPMTTKYPIGLGRLDIFCDHWWFLCCVHRAGHISIAKRKYPSCYAIGKSAILDFYPWSHNWCNFVYCLPWLSFCLHLECNWILFSSVPTRLDSVHFVSLHVDIKIIKWSVAQKYGCFGVHNVVHDKNTLVWLYWAGLWFV